MTKIAFRSASADSLRRWLESGDFSGEHGAEARTSTRYLPKRHEEMVGGSLYWIHKSAIIGRSPLLGFAEADDGRWWIRMAPRLIAVHPIAKRAHQGWRYLADADAPRDLAEGEAAGDAMPGRLVGKLAKLGLA